MSTQRPLTFQQQWLWNVLQKHPRWKSVAAYAFRVQGSLDVELLRRSLAEVVRRHDALRTRVLSQQHIDEQSACALDVRRVEGESASAIERNAIRLVEDFSDQTLDVAAGPLLSVKLLKLSECEHWLLIAAHRLIGDCASIDQISRELWALYGNPAALASNPPQYGDYASRQQASAEAWRSRHAAYWQKRLEGAMPLQWPLDEGLSSTPRGTISAMGNPFGEPASAAVRELARQQRTLSASVMFAIYVAVLWRWCGQKDFVVPFMIAGRQSEEKSMIGYFSHILYLRIELTGAETFSQLLSYCSNEFFRALSHQDFGRMPAQRPELLTGTFFQWITWHLNETWGPPAPSELRVERLPIRDFAEGLTAIPPGEVDVEVTFFDTAQGIRASGVYRADRFKASTMERFMGDLQAAVERFTQNPNAPIS